MKSLTLTIILLVPCFFCFAQNAPAPELKTNNSSIDKELIIVKEIKGLGSRADVIKYISSADSDFVFKRRDDVNGKPDYYASDRYLTSVEMVGNDDEIIMAKWTMTFFLNNGPALRKESNRMGYFAMLMGGDDCANWLFNIYKNFAGNLKEEYTETKEFTRMGRIAVFKYSPDKRCLTLTITLKDRPNTSLK